MEQPGENIHEPEVPCDVAESSPQSLQEPKTHVSDEEVASNQKELQLSTKEAQAETTDKAHEETSEQVPEETPEQIPEKAPEQVQEDAAMQVLEEAPKQVPEDASEQVLKETSEKFSDEAPEETTVISLEDASVHPIPEPEVEDQEEAQQWDHKQEENEEMMEEESQPPLGDANSYATPWMPTDEDEAGPENQVLTTGADMKEEIQEVAEPAILDAQKPPSALGLVQKPKRQPTKRPRIPLIQPAQIMYKAAAPVSRLQAGPCRNDFLGASVKGARMGSNRQIAEMIRKEMFHNQHACRTLWAPNSPCCVPPRTKLNLPFSKLSKTAKEEEWRLREERDKERRDHELAKELGYETLVGNILYIDIPGGRDINRSWQNFLSQDTMEWGFPYQKGSMERPRMKQLEPYLAHQVKEKLWKFPRSRTFQITTDD